MAKEKLPVEGAVDTLLWGKMEKGPQGDLAKFQVYPITRYRNVLNRPKLVTEAQSIAGVAYGEFELVTTDVVDVDDELVANLYRQIW